MQTLTLRALVYLGVADLELLLVWSSLLAFVSLLQEQEETMETQRNGSGRKYSAHAEHDSFCRVGFVSFVGHKSNSLCSSGWSPQKKIKHFIIYTITLAIGEKEPICNILFPDFLTTNLVKQIFNILLENLFFCLIFLLIFLLLSQTATRRTFLPCTIDT